MLYNFAGTSSRLKPQSAEAQGKARALSPAAAGISPSPASATAPDGAAPDARQAQCASNPGNSTPGTAAEVYDHLVNDPDRATEITIVPTELQDASVQRLDSASPPQAAPAVDKAEDADSYRIETLEKGGPRTIGQRARRKRWRASAPEGEAAAAGVSSAEPAESAALVSSPACSYRRADASNQFVLNFPVN